MTATLTVVGQGYVGLPLAQAASKAGWKVWGLEVSAPTVDGLNDGRSHIDDIHDEDIEWMLGAGYEATLDAARISESDVIVICVPTPLDEDGVPDLEAVRAATRTVGKNLSPGSLVVLESTTHPGTTEDVVLPTLEGESGLSVASGDFDLAFSPERVDPGNPKYGIANTPKLVGGVNERSTGSAYDFYSSFVDTVVPLSGAKEAEMAKLLENTFRHVNIALVNEMAKFCHELGIDIWESIRGAATKPFGFMKFTPGPGVGGHCIPIDPNYLSHEVRRQLGYPFRFVELAQEVNNSMPAYVVSRVGDLLNDRCRSLSGSEILLLGVTYKPDIADQRESPAPTVAALLEAKGATVRFHDPYVENLTVAGGEILRVADLYAAVRAADVVVLLQPHADYDLDAIAGSAAALLDTQGATNAGIRL